MWPLGNANGGSSGIFRPPPATVSCISKRLRPSLRSAAEAAPAAAAAAAVAPPPLAVSPSPLQITRWRGSKEDGKELSPSSKSPSPLSPAPAATPRGRRGVLLTPPPPPASTGAAVNGKEQHGVAAALLVANGSGHRQGSPYVGRRRRSGSTSSACTAISSSSSTRSKRGTRKRGRTTTTPPPMPPEPTPTPMEESSSSSSSTMEKEEEDEDKEEEEEEEEVGYALQLCPGLLHVDHSSSPSPSPSPTPPLLPAIGAAAEGERAAASSSLLVARVRADFAELCGGLGGKFQGARRTQFSTGGSNLGCVAYVVPEEHYQAMARVMSPRDRGACIVNAGAIEWFPALMEALGERAWPSFESQWLGTIRRDEGAVAAEEAAAVLASLDPSTTKRRARILTHQVASLTLLGYTASLSAHKDAPMFGHTIGAVTVAGQGKLTLRPVGFRGKVVEVTQRAGDFYSFCGPYRDDATHAAAVLSTSSPRTSPTPPSRSLPSPSPSPSTTHDDDHHDDDSAITGRWALLIRTWLPGRIRYVRLSDQGDFAGYRLLGTNRLDFNEETHGDAFLAHNSKGHKKKKKKKKTTTTNASSSRSSRSLSSVLRPDYSSLKRVMADLGEKEKGEGGPDL